MSIQSTLTAIRNDTAKTYAENSTPGNTQLDQDDFLRLMMVQLQQQDPMNPTSNEDFLNQQAMLTQVSELETISNSNAMIQASNMIGKEVTAVDPDDGSAITGVVSEVIRNSDGVQIRIPYEVQYIKEDGSVITEQKTQDFLLKQVQTVKEKETEQTT